MNGWLVWLGGGLVMLVVAAALLEAYVKRNRPRRMVDTRPDPARLKRRAWDHDPPVFADGPEHKERQAAVAAPDKDTPDERRKDTDRRHRESQ